MKDRELPDTISHYVSFRVWLVFFHPVPSYRDESIRPSIPRSSGPSRQHPCEELDQRYDHDI